jgi:Zn-dependent M28 family amino/carboxypeptidase
MSAVGADINFLASPALGGREAGTAGDDSTAEFLAQRYQQLGLRPAFHLRCDSAPSCPESYFQPFRIERGVAQNVGAVVDGSDPLSRTQFVVLGAHYDHLGRSPTFALDRDRGFALRLGADDNASGTAGLLELARRLHDRPARRSILIVNFDAEELGLIGSRVFLNNAPVPRAAMTFMINLDMIGRLRANRLFVEGNRERAIRPLIDSAVAAVGLRADYIANEGRSDHAPFSDASIDIVALSTGYHADYHTASDIAARINLVGMERVIDVAELIVRGTADR